MSPVTFAKQLIDILCRPAGDGTVILPAANGR